MRRASDAALASEATRNAVARGGHSSSRRLASNQVGEVSQRRSGGGIVTRAIRSHQLWITVAYLTAMLLLVRAYT